MQFSISEFGFPYGSFLTNTNGAVLHVDGEWFVDFDQFVGDLFVELTFIAKIAAAPLPGGVFLWASDLEGDASATGALLAAVEIDIAGTGGVYKPQRVSASVTRPTGKKYVALTSSAGYSGGCGGTSTELDYRGISFLIREAP